MNKFAKIILSLTFFLFTTSSCQKNYRIKLTDITPPGHIISPPETGEPDFKFIVFGDVCNSEKKNASKNYHKSVKKN